MKITFERDFAVLHKNGGDLLYDSLDLAMRIKGRAKEQKIHLKVMLTDCNLGINAISQLAKNEDFSSKSLCLIADYLDCSVDYLLGRTERPEINK